MNNFLLVPTRRVGTQSRRAALIVIPKCNGNTALWSALAERSGDNALAFAVEHLECLSPLQSKVARMEPAESGANGAPIIPDSTAFHPGYFALGMLLAAALVFTNCRAAETSDQHAGHLAKEASAASGGENTMTISSERLQAIGVKFEEAARRDVEKTIHTVGRVETDERLLARVNIKLEGWIDQLYVNTTGQKVAKGQLLFTLYSPELVATQEEYLLALRAAKTLGKSDFPEVADGARSILDVSRRRLQLWDVADYHIKELERSGKVLKTLPFHAPLSGTVIEKNAVAGMRVMPGEVLYTIADLSKVWVAADIYEYELPLIRVGQSARVSLSYAPQSVFTGRIGFIYPTVDPETRTAKVRFELDNPDELLKPGMYANVALSVPLGVRLAVSKDAVLESGERQIIFIHHGGGKLEWRNIKVGLRSGDWVEILEGLNEGEHIVTSANFLIDSESQLKAAVGGMAGMKH